MKISEEQRVYQSEFLLFICFLEFCILVGMITYMVSK